MTGICNVKWVREVPVRGMVITSAGRGSAGLRGGLPVQFLEFLPEKKKMILLNICINDLGTKSRRTQRKFADEAE